MPSSRTTRSYFDFSGGFTTENSALDSSPNTCRDISNLDIRRDGSLEKRAPLVNHLQTSFFFNSPQYLTTGEAEKFFVWNVPFISTGGVAYPNAAVVLYQTNGFVTADYSFDLSEGIFKSFGAGPVYDPKFRLSNPDIDPTPDELTDTLSTTYTRNTSSWDISHLTYGGEKVFADFAVIQDHLVITHSYGDFATVKFRPSEIDSQHAFLDITYHTLYSRNNNFYGLSSIPELDKRPTDLSPNHEFNLRNAGWPLSYTHYISSAGTYVKAKQDPIQYVYDQLGVYPALSDVFHRYKTDYAYSASDPDSLGAFSVQEMDKKQLGSLYSPRGRVIERVFAPKQDRLEGLLIQGRATGVDLVTNGDFATATDWTLGVNSTISGGELQLYDTAEQPLNDTYEPDVEYLLEVDISSYVPVDAARDEVVFSVDGKVILRISGQAFSGTTLYKTYTVFDKHSELGPVLKMEVIPGENTTPGTVVLNVNSISFHPTPLDYTEFDKDVVEEHNFRRRAGCCSAYASRVFFSGIDDPDLQERIYYSKVLDSASVGSLKDIGYCFSEGDPTSEVDNEVVPTDGGSLKLDDSGGVIRLVSFSTSILAFCRKGVWEISGADGNFFTATSQRVRKISSDVLIGNEALIVVKNGVVFCTDGDVSVISAQESTGFLVSTSLSESKVDSYYYIIPSNNKKDIRLSYDNRHNKVYIHHSLEEGTVSGRNSDILIMDLTSGTFTKYYVPEVDAVNGNSIRTISSSYVNLSEFRGKIDRPDLLVFYQIDDGVSKTYKFAVFGQELDYIGTPDYPYELPGNRMNDEFKDFGRNAYEAYVKTPFETLSTSGSQLQAGTNNTPYMKSISSVDMIFNRTEVEFRSEAEAPEGELYDPSSCKLYYNWNAVDHEALDYRSPTEELYSGGVEAYRLTRDVVQADNNLAFNYPTGIIKTKNRVKGRGNYLTFLFKVDLEHNIKLLGYSVKYRMGSRR